MSRAHCPDRVFGPVFVLNARYNFGRWIDRIVTCHFPPSFSLSISLLHSAPLLSSLLSHSLSLYMYIYIYICRSSSFTRRFPSETVYSRHAQLPFPIGQDTSGWIPRTINRIPDSVPLLVGDVVVGTERGELEELTRGSRLDPSVDAALETLRSAVR